MYTIPDAEQVKALAADLGLTMSSEEATIYQARLTQDMAALDAFVQARLPVDLPPMVSPSRAPGHRPSAVEDPLNAWTWRCHIEGAPEGLLAGKTVGFKDHIAVAGIPAAFGAFPLEGFVPDFDATVVTRVLEAGGTITGKNVMDGLTGGFGFENVRPGYIRAYDTALADVDVLVMPTMTTAPRYEAPATAQEALEVNLGLLSSGVVENTMPLNYTGHPALALPVGKSGGLPVSMQLVGRTFDDALVLRMAQAFQDASGWEAIIGIDA